VEQDWSPSSITLGHLQKLMKHGFMSATELETCWVLMDPTLPAPTEGYVVSFTAFYERGFDVPPHLFLCLLLWYYGLELHHQTQFGVLHIAVFVTLCEAYLGVDPDLDLCKYFFRVRWPQDPKAELMISGCAVIHVKSRHGVDPYIEIPMPRSMKGWQKRWFFLKNDDSASVPTFFEGHPIPLTSWGEGAIGKDLSRIQTLRENLQQLRWEGLTEIHPLQTSFNHRIQPLQLRKTKI
jgi:hypothetical protein